MPRLKPINKAHISIGSITLFIGLLFYLTNRPSDQIYFICKGFIPISMPQYFSVKLGIIGLCLPSFVHVFSFSIITAGWISSGKRSMFMICLVWFIIDSLFELGQKYNIWSSSIVPDWFFNVPFLENTKNYFMKGTFDYFDLIAISIGAASAYLVLIITETRKMS